MKRILSMLLTLGMILVFGMLGLNVSADAVTLSGQGTDVDPYIVNNADDFAQIQLNLTATYEIQGDIGPITTSIGSSTNQFTGKITGKKIADVDEEGAHITRNPVITLNISASGMYQGLVGYSSGATIENITTDGSVTAGRYSAGIVGGSNGATITGCINKANITSASSSSAYNIGGIVGGEVNSSAGATIITDCDNYGKITATSFDASSGGNVGGIIGNMVRTDSRIAKCKNYGEIDTNGMYVGGITGNLATGGVVSLSANVAKVKSVTTNNTTNAVGGIVGACQGTVEKSFNTGEVSAPIAVGGIAGNPNYAAAILLNNYNTGKVTATTRNVGGIAYATHASARVENNYNVGEVSLSNGADTWSASITLISDVAAGIKNNYYLKDLQPVGGGTFAENSPPTGLSKSEMMILSSFVGFNDMADDKTVIWDMESNGGYSYKYPTLKENPHFEIGPPVAELPEVLVYATPFAPQANPTPQNPIEFEGNPIETPYFAVAAKAPDYAGYTLVKHGFIFSKTNATPEIGTDIEAQAEGRMPDGGFGMLFYGSGITADTTYYLRAYAIYEREGEESVYSNAFTVTTSDAPVSPE